MKIIDKKIFETFDKKNYGNFGDFNVTPNLFSKIMLITGTGVTINVTIIIYIYIIIYTFFYYKNLFIYL